MAFRQNRCALLSVAMFLSLSPELLRGQGAFGPQGSEYAVVGVLPGDQTKVASAFGPNRGIVVWQDNHIDQQGLGIAAHWLGAAGDSYLDKFKINQSTSGDQENPSLAFMSNGDVVVVWQSGNGVSRNVYGRVLRADGTFASPGEVKLNANTPHLRGLPSVAALPNGRAVAVWESLGQDDAGNSNATRRRLTGVYGCLIDQAGNPVGSEFLVNTTVEFGQRTPVVTALRDGRFVVAWVSERLTGFGEAEAVDSVNVIARIFSADGAPLSGELRLNDGTEICANPDLVADVAGGGFAAVWSQRNGDDEFESWDVVARELDASGSPVSSSQMLNTFTYGDQFAPKIATVGDQRLVVWTSLGQDGSWEGVYGRFVSGGAAVGDEFRVNTATVSKQFFPTIAANQGSGFTVIWSSFIGGVGSVDLMAQRLWQVIPSPAAPAVSALSAWELLVAWSPVNGLEVEKYLVYVDGASTPVETSANFLKVEGLQAGTTHSFRIAFRLADGRTSPLSGVITGKTWGNDGNYDGLPDDWQRTYFGEATAAWGTPLVDSDGDGMSNLMEFLAGTNPKDASSVMRMAIVSTALGHRVDWNALPGSIFQLQRSEDFQSWQNVGGGRLAAGTTDGILVEDSSGLGYYRVVRVR